MKYTIKRGDTLTAIAAKYDTTVSAIMSVNPAIKNANAINVGWVITIPESKNYDEIGKAFERALRDVENLDSVKELKKLMKE